jgi:hypothetical protein
LAYTGPHRVIRVSKRENLNLAVIRHEETGKEVTVNTRKLKILQTKEEASTCLMIGCSRPVERGRCTRTGLPKRACCGKHWDLAMKGKRESRDDEKVSKVSETNTPDTQNIMALPGDWVLVKIRSTYYVGVALRYEEHRDEWIVQYVNTYGKPHSNARYRRCWIDEKDGMEFFSSQPSRVTSRYRPLITNVRHNQIKGVIHEDDKGRIPKAWTLRLMGKTTVRQVKTPLIAQKHIHRVRKVDKYPRRTVHRKSPKKGGPTHYSRERGHQRGSRKGL